MVALLLRGEPRRARIHGFAARIGLLGLVMLVSGCAPTAFDLGEKALREGDPAGAIESFDAALEAGDDRFLALRERGAARLEMGDPEAALVDLTAARQIRDHDARLQWLIGQANSQLANYDAATAAYQRYQMLSSSRAVKRLASMRLAQLRQETARATAVNLIQARQLGIEPDPETVALFAFKPYGGVDASEEDQKICRALSVWVTADLAKVASLRPVAADAVELLYEAQGVSLEERWRLDPSSMVAAGNLQPARHMVRGEYGTVADGRAVMLGVAYDSQRQEAADFPVQEDDLDRLFDMQTQFVLEVLAAMDVEPTAAELEAISKKPTRDRRAFLAFADGLFRLWDLGDFDGAQRSFERASGYDPGFAMAVDAATLSEAKSVSAQGAIAVPPPPPPRTGTERALRSSSGLGQGLVPDDETGEADGAETQNVVTVRGTATLRVRAEISP